MRTYCAPCSTWVACMFVCHLFFLTRRGSQRRAAHHRPRAAALSPHFLHTHPSTCLPAQGPIHGAASDVARGDAFLTALVGRIDASVAPGAASLTGGAAPTPADRAVAAALYDALALLFPPAGLLASGSYPNYARWAAATFTDPEFARAQEAAGRATGGCTRVGGQVDLRSDPAAVSRQADASIERNAGQAKAQSQRAAEDAAKAAKAARAQQQPRPPPAAAALLLWRVQGPRSRPPPPWSATAPLRKRPLRSALRPRWPT